jgi:hypothetical protein
MFFFHGVQTVQVVETFLCVGSKKIAANFDLCKNVCSIFFVSFWSLWV